MQTGFVGSSNLNIKSGAGGKFESNLIRIQNAAARKKELKFKRFKTQI
ncbi:hypothetical protein [uncultured Campylobacter sp.]|nr:hypothetical protein [uncultured Campylobacter sp.]